MLSQLTPGDHTKPFSHLQSAFVAPLCCWYWSGFKWNPTALKQPCWFKQHVELRYIKIQRRWIIKRRFKGSCVFCMKYFYVSSIPLDHARCSLEYLRNTWEHKLHFCIFTRKFEWFMATECHWWFGAVCVLVFAVLGHYQYVVVAKVLLLQACC